MSDRCSGPLEEQCRDMLKSMQRELIKQKCDELKVIQLVFGPDEIRGARCREKFFECLAEFVAVVYEAGRLTGFSEGKGAAAAAMRGSKRKKSIDKEDRQRNILESHVEEFRHEPKPRKLGQTLVVELKNANVPLSAKRALEHLKSLSRNLALDDEKRDRQRAVMAAEPRRRAALAKVKNLRTLYKSVHSFCYPGCI